MKKTEFIDSWKFSWKSRTYGEQNIRLSLYKYTEFLHPGGCILEYERDNGTIFYSYRMNERVTQNLASYFIELLCFITLDKDFFDEKDYVNFDRFNEMDLQLLQRLSWCGGIMSESMTYNPKTLTYSFTMIATTQDTCSENYWDFMKTLNIEKTDSQNRNLT